MDPKTSLWISTDPLSGYNPMMEDEHYIDGEHNGGVYNDMNINPYIYTYQSPLRYIDPNGKQVDLFGKKDGNTFHNVAKADKSTNNDGIVNVYAHANSDVIQYEEKGKTMFVRTAKQFNTLMSRKSSEWKEAMKDNKPIVLKLYSCNTASEEYVDHNGSVIKRTTTIAEKISKEYPNVTVVAADGYVWYGQKNGRPAILGVQQTDQVHPGNTNSGGFVTIKNGKTVAKQKMSYDDVTKVTKKGDKQKIK